MAPFSTQKCITTGAVLELDSGVQNRAARTTPLAWRHNFHSRTARGTWVHRTQEFKVEIMCMLCVLRHPVLNQDDALNKRIAGYHRERDKETGHKSRAPISK